MKLQKYISKVLDIFAALCLIMFFISFNFQDNLINGWYQQYLPAGITNNINSLVFTDSLTGYISTASDNNGVSYLLKTTNGGDNWFTLIRDTNVISYHDLQFLNKDTGIMGGVELLYKTTNAGISWITKPMPWPGNMYALNFDTIFIADQQSVIGGLWRTTNGGASWDKLVNFGSGNPDRVYFFNKDIGFIERSTDTYKTTDGGYNWSYIPSGGFSDIYFFDSLNGFLASGFKMKKTTNGGLNWVQQQLPVTSLTGIIRFSIINRDTIWGSYGSIFIGSGYRGVVYKTTNGGTNWGYQVPLNNNNIDQYFFVSFSNKLNGWAYWLGNTGVHTKIGGNDTTFFTGMKLVDEYTPKGYTLGQNYPNPFNPVTNIPFELDKSGYVTLIVYDITGKVIKELVNGRWGKGSYLCDFDGTGLSSGTYFYRIEITRESTKERYIDSKKMLMIK